MSTTRHLINRQRRLAAASTTSTTPTTPTPATPRAVRPAAAHPRTSPRATARTAARAAAGARTAPAPDRPRAGFAALTALTGRLTLPAVLTALLAAATVLLGAFAALAAHKAADLHDSAATGNTALTDPAATAQVKGAITADIDAVFSYDYADPARTDAAARRILTDKAVQQYATLIAPVRTQAPKQKLVLTTTVTSSGVEQIDGGRARLLVFADQRNTSTTAGGRTSYAAAMFAVDAVRQGGTWRIASIDTFG